MSTKLTYQGRKMAEKRKSYKEQIKMNRQQAAEARARIQSTKLIDQLHKCAMGDVELTSQQVKAIEIQLNKTMPALTAAELQATVENKNTATQQTLEDIAKFNDNVKLLKIAD